MNINNGAWLLILVIYFLCIHQACPASTAGTKQNGVSASTEKSVVYRSVTTQELDIVKRGTVLARRNRGKKPSRNKPGRWQKARKRSSGVSKGGISGFIAFGMMMVILIVLVAIFLTWRYKGRHSRRRTIEHKPLPTTESSHEYVIMD